MFRLISFFILFSMGTQVLAVNSKVSSWNDKIFYFSLLDRVNDGDKSNNFNVNTGDILSYHGGDLKGFIKKEHYLKKLGINGLIFTPLLDNRDEDFFGHFALHGYWPKDHFKLDEHWGSFQDLISFNHLKKKNKWPFLVDIVLNHMTWDHPWLKEHPQWFNTLGPITDWNDENQLVKGQVTGLPDLNQDNSEVYELLLDYTKFWINKTQAQGIRLDAIKHISHSYWKKYLNDIKKYAYPIYGKDFLILGELLHGDPHAYIEYVKDGFNSFYNYPLYYSIKDVVAQKGSFFNLAARQQELDHAFGDIIWVNFIDNHDLPRFLSLAPDLSKDHLLQAWSIALFSKGISFLYYGTEEMMEGKDGEQGRKSLDFKDHAIFEDLKALNLLKSKYAYLLESTRKDVLVEDDLYISSYQDKDEILYLIYSRVGEHKKIEIPTHLKVSKISSLLNKTVFPILNGKILFKSEASGLDFLYLKRGGLAKNPSQSSVKLTINLDAPEDGDYYLVGNTATIGGWNPKNAVHLNKNKLGIYQAHLTIPKDQILSFKFISKKKDMVSWESIAQNRFLMGKEDEVLKFEWSVQ